MHGKSLLVCLHNDPSSASFINNFDFKLLLSVIAIHPCHLPLCVWQQQIMPLHHCHCHVPIMKCSASKVVTAYFLSHIDLTLSPAHILFYLFFWFSHCGINIFWIFVLFGYFISLTRESSHRYQRFYPSEYYFISSSSYLMLYRNYILENI